MTLRLYMLCATLTLATACPTELAAPEDKNPASDSCEACTAGMLLDEADCSCTDIDECATDNGGCDVNALCENAAVSGDAPTCVCNQDYFGDGTTCTSVSTCNSDEYEATAPSATSDRVCESLTLCSDDEYESAAPTASSDRECTALSVCSSEEYESTAATATSDRACTALTVCTETEYETTAATSTSDRVCAALTVCGENEVEATAATATTDRICGCDTGFVTNEASSCVL